MSKLKLITKREFIAKVRNKSFIVMTFLMPLLMVGMMTLTVYLSKKNTDKAKEIAYFNASSFINTSDLKNNSTVHYIPLKVSSFEQAKKEVQEGDFYGLLYIPKEETIDETAKNIQFYSKKAPGTTFIEALEHQLSKKIKHVKYQTIGISEAKMKEANIKTVVNVVNFEGEKTSKLLNGAKVGIGSAAGYLIMMFIIIYGNLVMRSVIEEKTSRIIEIIISSVKPFDLMLGKIFGTSLAGLLQFTIWAALGFVILTVAQLFLNIDPAAIPNQTMLAQGNQMAVMENGILDVIHNLPLGTIVFSFILFFLGGFLLYSSIYAAIGAAVDNETDTQQFVIPVIMPLMLGVYVGFASVLSDPNGPIATFFSIFPLTSPIVMMMRIPFGVPLWQITSALALLLLSFIGVVWVAAKIYRIGILMYGKKPTYKEIFNWIKNY